MCEKTGADRRRELRRRREQARLRRLKWLRRGIGGMLLCFLALLCVGLVKGKTAAPVEPVGTPLPSPAAVLQPKPEKTMEEKVREKLEELEEQFPAGSYWNHQGLSLPQGAADWDIVTDIPCDPAAEGDAYCNVYDGATKEFFPQYDCLTQCLGFSSMFSDQLFGEDAPIKLYRDFGKIRLGDQIRLTGAHHSMVVIEIEKGSGTIRVAECDADGISCEISWGREISESELLGYGEEIEYITRYAE